MDRRNKVAATAIAIVFVCAAVIYLSLTHKPGPPRTTVIRGTAPPVGAQASSGTSPIAPHVDETSGILTVQAGDEVDSNGVLVGVTSVVAPYSASSAPSKPASGEFMVVNVEVHNSLGAGGQPLAISSGSSFELQDSTGKVYNPTSLPGTANPPDGKVGPGATLNGALAYDVPSGQQYKLLFKNDQVSNGEIIIDLGRR